MFDRTLDAAEIFGLVATVRLVPVLVTLLAVLATYWFVRRRLRAWKRKVTSAPSRLLKGAAKAGAEASSTVRDVAAGAAGRVEHVLQERAVPAAQRAATSAMQCARAGASHATKLVDRASPHVQQAATAGVAMVKDGADVIAGKVANAAPAVRETAGVVVDAAKTGGKALAIMAQVKAHDLLDAAKAAQERRRAVDRPNE